MDFFDLFKKDKKKKTSSRSIENKETDLDKQLKEVLDEKPKNKFGLLNSLNTKKNDKPTTILDTIEKIKLKKEEEVEKIIENIKWHKNNLLLKLEGIDSIDNAEKFRNYYIIIDESELTSLEEQSFYYFQLLGCRVFVDHEYLGKVKDIDNFGSSDILLVEKEADKEEVLIPFLKKIIKDIDINNKEIKVKKVKGMQI